MPFKRELTLGEQSFTKYYKDASITVTYTKILNGIIDVTISEGPLENQKDAFLYFYNKQKEANIPFYVKIPIKNKRICNYMVESNNVNSDYCWYPKVPSTWRFLHEINSQNLKDFFFWVAVCKVGKEPPKSRCVTNTQYLETKDKWNAQTVIYYGVKNNFLVEQSVDLAASELLRAANFCNQISPVKFEFTDDESKMIFCLDFLQDKNNGYAHFQYYRNKLSHLYLYAEVFKPEIVQFIFNILLHELGHILGLPDTISEQTPSVIVLDTIMDSSKIFQFNDEICTKENLDAARSALVNMFNPTDL